MKKKLLCALLSAAMVIGITACGSGTSQTNSTNSAPQGASETKADSSAAPAETAPAAEEEKITWTMKVWAPSEDQNPDMGQWLQTMCERFNELHPNWDLTFEYGVSTESESRKLVLNDLEKAADVFMYSSTNLEYFCKEQALTQLGGKYLDAVNQHYSPTLIKSLTYEDGGVYGVPLTTNTYFMYYDKSVFTEEDVKSLDKMLEKGKVSIAIEDGFYNACFFLGAGGTFFGQDGMDRADGIKFNTPEGVAMAQYMVDLVKHPNFVAATVQDALSMMREGKVSAYFCGTWQAEQTKEFLGENFGIAPVPSVNVEGKDYQLRPFSSAKAIGIKSTTQYPQVAIELAMFLGGMESEKYHYEKRGYIPCYDELLNTPEIQADELVQVDSYSTSFAAPRMGYTEMSWFWTPAESFGKELTKGDITKENAAEKLKILEEAINKAPVE